MAGQNYLKERLQQTADYDAVLKNRTFGQGSETPATQSENAEKEEDLIARRIKAHVNSLFGEKILTESKSDDFKLHLRDAILNLLEKENLDSTKKKLLTNKILDDILGFGPIQELLEDESITEIMITRWDKIYVEQRGKLVLVPDVKFNNDDHLRTVIDKIVQPIGRRIDDSEPLVDARLPDGSRVNATIPPISPDGCTLSIRKFSKYKLTGEDYLNRGSLDNRMLEFLKLAVEARCNIIVSGGTGSGKTTLLNMLSNFIPSYESIVTVEDSCELNLYQDNVRRLEARAASAEGTGEISIRRLVKNTLRMRPDRIVVGEIRDGCLVDMFRAMSSGHDGSLTTVHANSPKDLVEATIPILFGMSDMSFSEEAQKQQICSSVDLIVQISRMRDGSRKITSITHIVGLGKDGATKLKLKQVEPGKIYLKDIFKYQFEGYENDGMLKGKFVSTGYMPKSIISKIESTGQSISEDLFVREDKSSDDLSERGE